MAKLGVTHGCSVLQRTLEGDNTSSLVIFNPKCVSRIQSEAPQATKACMAFTLRPTPHECNSPDHTTAAESRGSRIPARRALCSAAIRRLLDGTDLTVNLAFRLVDMGIEGEFAETLRRHFWRVAADSFGAITDCYRKEEQNGMHF